MTGDDDNETARYLASFLKQYEAELLSYSFDRNGAHNSGEYAEYATLNVTELEKKIKFFFDNLP